MTPTGTKRNRQQPESPAWIYCLIIGATLWLTHSATAQTLSPAFLTGQLVTGKPKTPVANAIVQWSIPGTVAGPGNSAITDATGSFAFEIPVPGATQVQLATIANLYNPTQTNVQLQPNATAHVTIRLTHKAAGQFGAVTGSVKNTGGLAISNAVVTILGAGDLLTSTTDSSGHFQLKHIGFNSNLSLQASTPHAPCILTTQVPLAVNATRVTASIQAPGVLSFTANCPPPPPGPNTAAVDGVRPQISIDDTVQWTQADVESITSPGAPNAWNAGRVNDVLRFPPGQGFLVASDEGGVWSIAEDASRTATPLSNKWPSVTISALAQGTGGPQDVYAGTFPYGNSPGGLLWETDTSQAQPLLNWSPLGTPCGSINKILVISEVNLILLACDTGLWWSSIPPAPSVKGTYNWQQALPAAIGSKAFSGLAKGPGWSVTGTIGTIIASRWTGSSTALIYTAKWTGSKLTLTPATIAATGKFSRTSVAACASNRQIMYAVASDSSGQALAGVFQSTNAGVNWNPVSLPSNPGLFGDSNQAVAVSPDCSTVAVGWQTGTFVSFNNGASWTMLTDTGEYNNLHVDIHALTFDPVLPGVLFIGSSGGVASTAGLTNGSSPSFESDWNRELFNLEFYDGGASTSFNGFAGAASQDNGVLDVSLPNPWQHADDCGGMLECWGSHALFGERGPYSLFSGSDLFVGADQLVPISSTAASITVGSPNIPFNGETAIPINPPCSPCDTYVVNVAAPVRNAASNLTNASTPCGVVNASSECMFAVSEMYVYGGVGDSVYGLFARPDLSGDTHWELLNSGPALWVGVTAIAPTYDGSSIFIGNDIGQIYRLDAPFTSPPVQLPVSVPASCPSFCPVTGLYAFNQGLAYAAYGSHFMQWAGLQWIELGQADLPHDRNFLSLVATDPSRIYIASSAGVFDTTNGGANWSNASTGLPTLISGTPGFQPPDFFGSHDYLQLVTTGQTQLYLASFGRSLWKTDRPLPSPPAQRSFNNIKIELWTGNDDARSNSEIQALLSDPYTSTSVAFCLKPSNTNAPSPGGVCPNGPTATDQLGNQSWPNGADVPQTFSLSPSQVLDGDTLRIQLIQHYSAPDTSDNWDIQAVQVSAVDGSGTLGLTTVTQALPFVTGTNNCIARLKESPNPGSVTYVLSANDPGNYNSAHPVPNFGPTPPGSCPQ